MERISHRAQVVSQDVIHLQKWLASQVSSYIQHRILDLLES
jgi:hypothetical protein